MSRALTDHPLRKEGFRLWPGPFTAFLGVGLRNGSLVRCAAARAEYMLGTEEDEDAQVVQTLSVSEIRTDPLHELDAEIDLVDMIRTNRDRIASIESCSGVVVCADIDGAEGMLVGDQLRRQMPGVMPVLHSSDENLPRARLDGRHRAYIASGSALIGSLAARAAASQILVDPSAPDSVERKVIDALRAARNQSSVALLQTRVLAWMAEVALRPMVSPDIKLGAPRRHREPLSGRMRIMK